MLLMSVLGLKENVFWIKHVAHNNRTEITEQNYLIFLFWLGQYVHHLHNHNIYITYQNKYVHEQKLHNSVYSISETFNELPWNNNSGNWFIVIGIRHSIRVEVVHRYCCKRFLCVGQKCIKLSCLSRLWQVVLIYIEEVY